MNKFQKMLPSSSKAKGEMLMKKQIKRALFALFLMMISAKGFSATFSVDLYGNLEATIREQSESSATVVSNADWKADQFSSYFELKFSGANVGGFDIWAKVGGSADFYNSSLNNSYTSHLFDIDADGISDEFISGSSENYMLRMYEASASQTANIGSGETTFTFFRTMDKSDLSQSYLDFYGDIGDGETRTGLSWDGYGILGFSTKGFILDYRSTVDDLDTSTSDKFAYAAAARISRDLVSEDAINFSVGVTGGANQYYKNYVLSGITGSGATTITNENKYFFNVLGADFIMNGEIPVVGTYYLLGELGRSYCPEEYVYEYRPGIGFLGNTNAMIFVSEFKWNREFEAGDINLGRVYLTLNVYGRQDHYQTYLGGGGDSEYYEMAKLTYHFPYKALSMEGYLEYSHDYDFTNEQYHLWNVGEISDNSVAYKKHLDFTVLFKSGFSLDIAWDKEIGNNYLGSFDAEGINYLTITAEGETDLGEISPQFKVVALGDPEKQLLSSGISVFLNITDWLKFYSRFAYVQSAGYWKNGDDVNWWNAFVQFQFYSGDNSKAFFELGNGGDTDSGFVSDTALINGAAFENKIYFKYEYWS